MKTLYELNEVVQEKIIMLDKVLMVMDSAGLEVECKNKFFRPKKVKAISWCIIL